MMCPSQSGTTSGTPCLVFDAFTLGVGGNYKWDIGSSVTLPTNQNHGDKRYGNDNWLAGIAGIGMLRFSISWRSAFSWQSLF